MRSRGEGGFVCVKAVQGEMRKKGWKHVSTCSVVLMEVTPPNKSL